MEIPITFLLDILVPVRLQVLTAASMKMIALWDTAPCSLIEVDRGFWDEYRLNHQDDDDGRQNAPLKRRSTSTRLHGAIFPEGYYLHLSSCSGLA
jgi:hypothetical protein